MALPPDPAQPTPGPAAESDPRRWNTFPSTIKRISWGAVFAGAVTALVLYLMLSLLGMAIGFSAINLTGEGATLAGLGIGTIVWLILTTIISFGAGGWVAGRLAGMPIEIDSVLHGFVSWAVASFVMFYFVASGLGLVIGGALGVVQQGVQLAGQGVAAVAPEAGRVISEQIDEGTAEELRSEVYAILRETGREELQPENLARRAEDVQQETEQAAGEAARSPEEAEQEIQSVLDRLIMHGEEVVDAADREAAVNVLVERTDMTEEEARQTVREYEEAIQDASARVRETAEEAGRTAVRTADEVIATVAEAAFWSFVAMLIGALVAAGGGFAGTPRDLPASTAVRRE